MYKVFFNDRRILFATSPDKDIAMTADAIYKFDTTNKLKEFIDDFLKKEHLNTAVIYGHNIDEIFEEFRFLFKNIEAAGGMVFNNNEEFIGLYRRGKNDLPKGKLEKGETPQTCAAREVKEECGIGSVQLRGKLTETYHIYFTGDTQVLKRTCWFNMFTEDKELRPQTEEDITDIFWVSLAGISDFAKNTYPSVKDVLSAAGY